MASPANQRGLKDINLSATLALPNAANLVNTNVLDLGIVQRLGSSRPINVDVRVISATHRDLAEAMAAGTFREDLYFRLSMFQIALPPLRIKCTKQYPTSSTFRASDA